MNSRKPSQGFGKILPLFLLVASSLILAGVVFWLNQPPTTVSANMPDIQLAESTYPNIVGTRIDACALCHTASIPNLNPYGAAYNSGGRGMASSLTNIQGVDSDGDGFTNLQEIVALTFPGNASDFPSTPPTSTPTRTSTNTQVPPSATATNTQVPPTATFTRTNTQVPPSATATATRTSTSTQAAPSATGAAPTSTSVAPSATVVPSATTVPSATRVSTATRVPTIVGATAVGTKRPTLRPTKTPRCVPDDSSLSSKKASERDDERGDKRHCPKGFHDGDDDNEREHEKQTTVERLREIYSRYSR